MRSFQVRVLAATLMLGCTLQNVQGQSREDQIVNSARAVLAETMSIPGRRIPQLLMTKAHGIAIIPNVVKGGLVVGVRHGRGVLLVRDNAGMWQAPIFVSLTGGSVGWQAGIQATDVVLVFRTRKSIDGLMAGKLTIGVDAAAAAGPIGRQAAASTDERLAAEILSYSKSRGLFAGVSFDGSVISLDHTTGYAYYRGTPQPNGQEVQQLPVSAAQLIQETTQHTNNSRVAVPVAVNELPGPVARRDDVVTGRPERGIDQVRSRLLVSWQRLSRLLDSRWQAYLALPPELLRDGSAVQLSTLNKTLERYSKIAADRRYLSLTKRSEFSSVHGTLREYVQLRSRPKDDRLRLPPPPSDKSPTDG